MGGASVSSMLWRRVRITAGLAPDCVSGDDWPSGEGRWLKATALCETELTISLLLRRPQLTSARGNSSSCELRWVMIWGEALAAPRHATVADKDLLRVSAAMAAAVLAAMDPVSIDDRRVRLSSATDTLGIDAALLTDTPPTSGPECAAISISMLPLVGRPARAPAEGVVDTCREVLLGEPKRCGEPVADRECSRGGLRCGDILEEEEDTDEVCDPASCW